MELDLRGLCERCQHVDVVRTARSRFLRCRRSDTDPGYPRYPVLPVVECRGFEERSGTRDSATDAG